MKIEVLERIKSNARSFGGEVLERMDRKGITMYDIAPATTELLGAVALTNVEYKRSFRRERTSIPTALMTAVMFGWLDFAKAASVFGGNAIETAIDRARGRTLPARTGTL